MVAQCFGTFQKDANEWYFTIEKPFAKGEYGASVSLAYVFNRGNICTKRVVGVETIPARFVEAHTEPAVTKEIIEWDCGSLLENESANTKND